MRFKLLWRWRYFLARFSWSYWHGLGTASGHRGPKGKIGDPTPIHVTMKGNWRREIVGLNELGAIGDRTRPTGYRDRYYWRRLRVPWVAWSLFAID